MIKQLKTNKMKNFRLFALLVFLLMVRGTITAQVQFESDTVGANCMLLAPIVDKSQIESVRYFAGDAGMVFDSSFNLVSATQNIRCKKFQLSKVNTFL